MKSFEFEEVIKIMHALIDLSSQAKIYIGFLMFAAAGSCVPVHFFSARRNKQRFLYLMSFGYSLIALAFLLFSLTLGSATTELKKLFNDLIFWLFAFGGFLWVISNIIYIMRYVGIKDIHDNQGSNHTNILLLLANELHAVKTLVFSHSVLIPSIQPVLAETQSTQSTQNALLITDDYKKLWYAIGSIYLLSYRY